MRYTTNIWNEISSPQNLQYQSILIFSLTGEMGDINSDDALFNEFACNLVVNTTFQSTTNQMTIQYKSNHDYDTERLVFTYSTGSSQIQILTNVCVFFFSEN